jgi:TfuA protein
MRLVMFSGPSLRPADLDDLREHAAGRSVDLVVHPPVARHDLLKLLDDEAAGSRVLIIDGEFGQSLAVSVTEIRTYLRAGRYVAGASSMGALRAVECRTLGMRAHGWVAARYADGTINADDEVALLFDPETLEPATIPLVNVRWLVGQLVDDARLDAAGAESVFAIAAAVHYRKRTPDSLANAARRANNPAADTLVAMLRPELLPQWDRKRLDALEAARTEINELAEMVKSAALNGQGISRKR